MWKFSSAGGEHRSPTTTIPTASSSVDIDSNGDVKSSNGSSSRSSRKGEDIGSSSSSSSSSSSLSSRVWCSAVMSSPNLWMLLGLGIAGLIIFARTRSRKHATVSKDFGAFVKQLELLPPPQPAPPIAPHPLSSLRFAVKDIFDVEGFVTGFGNPEWERTHEPASRTASAVTVLVQAGATCVGKTHMDEMAYSIFGQNKHYGTPVNPVAPSRMPGGSSSGSAVVVAAELVDFSLGTDTNGSVRIPAAFCGIMGFRPSHGAVSCIGVVPVSQSLDTVGWFAREPNVLCTVGHVLLQQPYLDVKQPKRVVFAEDCFTLLSSSENSLLPIAMNSVESAFGKQITTTRIKLGQYIASKVTSLKSFRKDGSNEKGDRGSLALKSLRKALQLLIRYEFKTNHEEWIKSTKPVLGDSIIEDIDAARQASADLVAEAFKVRNEARMALNELLMSDGILVMPTAPGPPPKLRTKELALADFMEKTFTLMGVAGMSGACQVSIPAGKQDGFPVSVSLVAKQGGDRFLLETAKSLFPVLQKEAEAYSSGNINDPAGRTVQRPEAAELAKEKGNAAFKKKDYRTAIECYSKAIRCDETNATYYSNRAAAYLALSSFHQAEADCSKAIDLEKKNVKAYLRRATAREFLGYHKEADEDFKQALVLEPTNKTAADGIERVQKFLYT